MKHPYERGQALVEAIIFVPAFFLVCAGGLLFAAALKERIANEAARTRIAHTAAWFPLKERETALWPHKQDPTLESFLERTGLLEQQNERAAWAGLFGGLGMNPSALISWKRSPSESEQRDQPRALRPVPRSTFLPAAARTFDERTLEASRALASSSAARSVVGHPARHGGLAGITWPEGLEANLRLISTEAYAGSAFEAFLARTAFRARATHHAACVAASLPTSFGLGGLIGILESAVTDGATGGGACPQVSGPVTAFATMTRGLLLFQAGTILALEACASRAYDEAKCLIPKLPQALVGARPSSLDRGDLPELRQGLGSAL
jgi:hypothetical protein